MADALPLPVIALLLSLGTFGFTAISMIRRAKIDDIQGLYQRVAQLERDLAECCRARQLLRDENLALLRKVLALPATG